MSPKTRSQNSQKTKRRVFGGVTVLQHFHITYGFNWLVLHCIWTKFSDPCLHNVLLSWREHFLASHPETGIIGSKTLLDPVHSFMGRLTCNFVCNVTVTKGNYAKELLTSNTESGIIGLLGTAHSFLDQFTCNLVCSQYNECVTEKCTHYWKSTEKSTG